MLELSAVLELSRPAAASHAPPGDANGAYAGPERRRIGAAMATWLLAAFDEIDYGIVLLDERSRLVHANHAARVDLDGDHPLQRVDGELRARASHDASALRDALGAARKCGFRKLLSVGVAEDRVNLAVVPLRGLFAGDGTGSTLVMFGKRAVCEQLSVQGFAHSNRLTAAETRVLLALCEGRAPGKAAAVLGVAISTVRTHIYSIRMKTGAQSIGELLRQVAVLPPLMNALRDTRLL